MLIAQQNGIVRVWRNGILQSTPFIDITQQVNGVRDRGLLGMAVHPNFAATPYVYLLFTYDPPQAANNINPGTTLDDRDGAGNRPARLIRVTATTDASGNVTAVPGSEVILLGENSFWEYTSRPDGNSTNDSSYQNLPQAQTFYANGGDSQVTAPIYGQTHASGAFAIIMGDFYDNNRLIFGDVNNGNIYEATFDQNRRISTVRVFDSGLTYVVDMEKGPDGNLYGVNLGGGSIFRWVPA